MSDPKPRPAGVPIPVFNCPAYLMTVPESGRVNARCASLPDVTAFGDNQREALSRLVDLFKQTITGYQAAGLEIPFREPPLPIQAGERAVYIAVHL